MVKRVTKHELTDKEKARIWAMWALALDKFKEMRGKDFLSHDSLEFDIESIQEMRREFARDTVTPTIWNEGKLRGHSWYIAEDYKTVSTRKTALNKKIQTMLNDRIKYVFKNTYGSTGIDKKIDVIDIAERLIKGSNEFKNMKSPEFLLEIINDKLQKTLKERAGARANIQAQNKILRQERDHVLSVKHDVEKAVGSIQEVVINTKALTEHLTPSTLSEAIIKNRDNNAKLLETVGINNLKSAIVDSSMLLASMVEDIKAKYAQTKVMDKDDINFLGSFIKISKDFLSKGDAVKMDEVISKVNKVKRKFEEANEKIRYHD